MPDIDGSKGFGSFMFPSLSYMWNVINIMDILGTGTDVVNVTKHLLCVNTEADEGHSESPWQQFRKIRYGCAKDIVQNNQTTLGQKSLRPSDNFRLNVYGMYATTEEQA